nr:PREDICTED: uncharacterized protein LOC105671157 [Linepithema humile]
MTHSLIKISGDIILIIDNLQFTLPIISTMLKIAIFWWKKEVRYITNITDPGRLLPLQTHYIYDTTKSPHYELTFISQKVSFS